MTEPGETEADPGRRSLFRRRRRYPAAGDQQAPLNADPTSADPGRRRRRPPPADDTSADPGRRRRRPPPADDTTADPGRTRHEQPAQDDTSADPGRTRRDHPDQGYAGTGPGRPAPIRPAGPPPAAPGRGDETTPDAGRERRRAGPFAGGRLPAALADRFLVEGPPLSGPGAPATVLRVRERASMECRVLKAHPPGVRLDDPIRELLPHLHERTSAIVRTYEVTVVDDVCVEVMEDCEGDLARLWDGDPRLGLTEIRAVVGRMAEALDVLHQAEVLHGDVKPSNMLGRDLGLDVVLGDFGSSRVLEAPFEDRLGPGTRLYLSPLAFLSEVDSFARDWWALGISVVELATGSHPFEDLGELAFSVQLTRGPGPALAALAEERILELGPLVRGLLDQDDETRWTAEQVRAWVADPFSAAPEPARAQTDDPRAQQHPFRLGTDTYTSRYDLAVGLIERWEWAVLTLLSGTGAERRRVRDWLMLFDDPGQDDVDGRNDLLDRLDFPQPDDTPHLLLLRLIRWLAPELAPPIYRRQQITPHHLAVLGRIATGGTAGDDPDTDAALIVQDLWRDRIVDVLVDTRAVGLDSTLVRTDSQWRGLAESWRRLLDGLAGRDPVLAATLLPVEQDPMTLGWLLWLAAEHGPAEQAIHARVRRTRRLVRPGLVGWYDRLLTEGGVLGRLACVLLTAQAELTAHEVLTEAGRAAARERAQRRRRARLLARQNIEEWYREQDRPIAGGWAVVGVALATLAWVLAVSLADLNPYGPEWIIQHAWVCALVAILVTAAAEAWMVLEVGGPYHPRYSMAGTVQVLGRLLARGDDRLGGWQALVASLVGVAAIVAAAGYVPWLLALAAVVGQLRWTGRRYRRWRDYTADRDRQRAQAREEIETAFAGAAPAGHGQDDG